MKSSWISNTKRAALVAALTLLTTGCGNESNAPSDGQIVLNAASLTFTNGNPDTGGCVGLDGTYIEGSSTGLDPTRIEVVDIFVLDIDGDPVGNADLELSIPFALNSTDGAVASEQMAIYDDSVTKGVFNVKVTGIGDPIPYITQTNELGRKTVHIYFEDSFSDCAYFGSMKVLSGVVSAQWEFDVGPAAP